MAHEIEIKQEICDEDYDMTQDVPDYIDINTILPQISLQSEKSPPDIKEASRKQTKETEINAQDNDFDEENKGKSKKSNKYIPRPRNCEICGQVLSCSKALNLHMRIHNDEKPYKCEICQKSFRQTGGLKTHMLTHSKEKPYACPDCGGCYTTSSSLKRHQKKIHESGKILTCKHCMESFYNKNALQEHQQAKHTDIFCSKECPHCGIILSTNKNYRRHLIVSHNKQSTKAKFNNKLCSLCGEEFETLKLYITHKNEHLQYTREDVRIYDLERIYPCKICGAQFSSMSNIVTHLAVHMEKTHKCEICNKEFSFLHWKQHKRKIHETVVCQICNEKFEGLLAVRSHRLRKHRSYRKCNLCDKSLSNIYKLEMHMNNVHKNAGSIIKRLHQCIYCQQVYYSRGVLYRHMLKFHKKNFRKSCDVCNLKFEYHHELVRHKQDVHPKLLGSLCSGEMFSCHICSKVFKNREGLRKHLYRHRDHKVRCYRCKALFPNRKSLQTHRTKNDCVESYKTCKDCNKKLNSSDFRRHALIHSINYKKCRFCDTEFDNLTMLKVHFDEHHPGEKRFHCILCSVDFRSFKEMMIHRKSYSHRKKFSTYFNIEKFKSLTQKTQCNEVPSKEDSKMEEVTIKTEYCEEEATDSSTTINLDNVKLELDNNAECSSSANR